MQKKEAQPLTRPNYAEPPPEYSLDTMPGESTGPRYRDFPWVIAFILHFIAVAVVAYIGWSHPPREDKHKEEPSSDHHEGDEEGFDLSSDEQQNILNTVLLTLVTAFILGFSSLRVLQSHPRFIIICAMLFMIAIALMMFIASVFAQNIILILFSAIFVAAMVYMFMIRRALVDFTATIISTCSSVVRDFPATILLSVLSVVVTAIWAILWVLIVVGTDRLGDTAFSRLLLPLFFSFFWTIQVIQIATHSTICGTMATWYFSAQDNVPPNPTMGSLKRTLTTSFGSVIFGAAIIALIQTAKVAIRMMANRNSRNFLSACAYCLLDIVEDLARLFNKYAFTQVAAYGKSFVEAAKATKEIIKTSGIEAIMNDCIIGYALFFVSLMSGILCGIFAAIVAALYDLRIEIIIVLLIVGIIFGAIITSIMLSPVDSCAAGLFVFYAEDPMVLQILKPDLYAALTTNYPAITPGRAARERNMARQNMGPGSL